MAQAREALLNPPKPSIGKRSRKRKNWGQYPNVDALSAKKRKMMPKKQRRTQLTKATKEPEVIMEKPTQEDTANQWLDDGMSAFNMQEMYSVLTIPPSDTTYLYNQQEPNGQQQETNSQNRRLPIPAPEPSQSWKQSGEFYSDPDGYCWLE